MGNCDVKIEIDRSKNDGVFTNYDIISGIVTLTVTNTISLNYIQVKLEGISKSELTIPNTRQQKKDRVIQDIHKVLYDSLIVFPPENIRQVSNAKEFTLTPGNYNYPFSFKIPLNNSCIKLSGITNKVSINKNFDIKINNGNFNRGTLKNLASQYISNLSDTPSNNNGNGHANGSNRHGHGYNNPSASNSNYHITNQLPPSLSGQGDVASIKYFVKVTCKRSSFLKVNLRSFDPFIFLPIDLDSTNNKPLFNSGDFVEYREIFIRKDIIFKNRIPEIIGMKVEQERLGRPIKEKMLPNPPSNLVNRKGFFAKIFDTPSPQPPSSQPPKNSHTNVSNYPTVPMSDVPFAFEVRFRYPSFLIPTKPLTFKLYLVSSLKPSIYSLAEYGKPNDSNGLGVIYLQQLIIELTATTIVSVLEQDGVRSEIHKSKKEEVIPIIKNNYSNLKFDLINCKKTKSSSSTSNSVHNNVYELEIPKQYFSNCVIPDYVSPSFKTCNIQRKYKLTIVGGFTSEKIDYNHANDNSKKIRYVDLQVQDINILSGLGMTSTLASNSHKPSLTSYSSNHSIPLSSTNSVPPPFPPANNSQANAPLMTGGPPITSKIQPQTSKSSSPASSDPPDLPQRPNDSNDSLPLPTYDDVMRESSFQNDSDHILARRRYQQHQAYYENLED